MRSLAFCLLMIASLAIEAETLEGIAKNQKGEIVYLEKHTILRDESGLNKLINVEYSKPNGEKFASMTSDFSKNKTVPDTSFEDSRFNTRSLIRVLNGSVEFEEIKDGKSTSKKTTPLNDAMVASQGFDNFIRLNFAKLESNSVEFLFGVLDSQDFFSLTGYKKQTQQKDETEFGIKASNFLLRLLANELRVTYDSKTKQLKSFSGRSNILTDSGKPQEVEIAYSWKSEK